MTKILPTINLPIPSSARERSEQRGYSEDTARRAEALADIQRMNEDLALAHETIGQLKADLANQHNKNELIEEERNRYRAEALVFRTKLVELATSMTNIGLLTNKAQDIMKTVHELTTEAETPATDVLDALEAELNGKKEPEL